MELHTNGEGLNMGGKALFKFVFQTPYIIKLHRYGKLNLVLNINHFPNMVNKIWVTLHIADTCLFKGECLKDK